MEPGGLQLVGVIMVVSAIGEVLRARGETGALVEELVPFFNDRCSLSFMDSDRRGDGVPLELE